MTGATFPKLTADLQNEAFYAGVCAAEKVFEALLEVLEK